MTYGFGYDEELPAGFQDADFEQRELEELGNRMARLKKRGICVHGSWVGHKIDPATGKEFYPEQVGLSGAQVRCTDGCGQVFESDDAIWDAHVAVREGY